MEGVLDTGTHLSTQVFIVWCKYCLLLIWPVCPIVIQSYNALCVCVCLFTWPHGLSTLQTKPSNEHADRGYKWAAGREEEPVGTQEGPELVDKHAEDTIDNQEHENPIEVETLLNPKEINGKR